MTRPARAALACALVATGCAGGSHAGPQSRPTQTPVSTPAATTPSPPALPATSPTSRPPVALVTAERDAQVIAVRLPGGGVVRRIAVAPDPTTIAAGSAGPAIVVSPAAAAVTLVSRYSLRAEATLRGFGRPEIAAVAPGGRIGFVTDAARGTLVAIDLRARRVVARVAVGAGAHHMAVSPDGRRVWVALGETAHTVVIVDTADVRHMHVARVLHPAVVVHDLVFAPGGRQVWAGAADVARVSVFGARAGRLLATVPAGPPPQHVAFSLAPARVYVTSGYGSSMEEVNLATRAVVARVRLPYGSFNLALSGRLLVTTSLMSGTVTGFDAASLERRFSRVVAPAAREVAII